MNGNLRCLVVIVSLPAELCTKLGLNGVSESVQVIERGLILSLVGLIQVEFYLRFIVIGNADDGETADTKVAADPIFLGACAAAEAAVSLPALLL